MKAKEIVLFGVLVILTAALAAVMYQLFYGGGSLFGVGGTQDVVDTTNTEFVGETEDDVAISNLEVGANITASPLIFSGEADPDWFSSVGTFIVQLQDIDGNVLGTGTATTTAKGDLSQLSGKVPFTAEISFDPTSINAPEGVVVLKKDNPTDDPGNGAEIMLSVVFEESGRTTVGDSN